jgi:hypothetical protein
MKFAVPFALTGLALVAPLAALADPLPINTGIYLTNDDLGRGGAAYASSNTITIYSGGGATESDGGLGTYHVTQTPTALGALSGTLATYNDDGALGTNVGTASATANLATKTVGGTVTGNQRGETTSLLNDVLTFHVAGGGSAEVGFGMELDGTISSEGQKSIQFVLDFDFSNVYTSQYVSSDGKLDPVDVTSGGAISDLVSSSAGIGQFSATGDYLVADGDSRRLQFGLYLDCSGSAVVCDFTNAGHLSLDLPDGVTVTDTAGVFSGGDVSAVPEPANVALILAGLAAMGGISVRRRRLDVQLTDAMS